MVVVIQNKTLVDYSNARLGPTPLATKAIYRFRNKSWTRCNYQTSKDFDRQRIRYCAIPNWQNKHYTFFI